MLIKQKWALLTLLPVLVVIPARYSGRTGEVRTR